MNGLVLIGGGGHCKSVLDAALKMEVFPEIVILDPCLPVGSKVMGCTVAGGDDKLGELFHSGFENAFIAVGCIGDTSLRRRLVDAANICNFVYPSIIDPSAVVSEFAKIDVGVFVGKKSVVNAGTKIGKHAIINTGAIIEHDCRIGAFTHVSVGATICGGCNVEDDVFIGTGANIIQGIKVKKNSFIKAGEIVIKST